MNNINLNEYVTDEINIIEIYFINKITNNKNIIDVKMQDNIDDKISKSYKKFREEKYKMYFMKDKIYTYEISNDNQYVTSKNKKTNGILKTKKGNIYIVGSKIDKYPQHVFPCTNDIDNISEISISEYKITNRISLIIKCNIVDNTKTLLIEYKHSLNVELDKIMEIINKLVKHIEVILTN
tara:strand:- start:10481 stop:11023 length:543 start_codon:yes stop_codon:yes gene_type:complete